jgi:peptidoglycan L-alanyl-D-glutamate endopeptidase CwlK
MRTWSERSLRNLQGINPDLRKIMDRALEISPLDFVVIEGLRTKERQRELVAKGASRTMKSRHLTGHAVDLVPLLDLDRDGKVETTEMFNWPLMRQLAVHIKQAAKDVHVPIEWGGDWTSFPDGPHWQLPAKAYP